MNRPELSTLSITAILPLGVMVAALADRASAFDSGCFQTAVEANDRASQDYAGQTVAARAGMVLMSAPGDTNESGTAAGAVYVFRDIGGQWIQSQKLRPGTLSDFDYLGLGAMDLNGDRLIVGCPDHDAPTDDEGAIYIYTLLNGTSWAISGEIMAPPGTPVDGNFGEIAAIDGEWAVVGMPTKEGFFGAQNAGGWYIYRHTGPWTLYDQSPFMAPQSFVGYSVDIEGNFMVAGVPGSDVNGVLSAGSVLTYALNNASPPQWMQGPSLVPNDPQVLGNFGKRVVTNGTFTFVASEGIDVNGQQDAGAVYVFLGNAQVAKFTAPTIEAGALFGFKIALDGNTLVVNDVQGHVYRYRWNGANTAYLDGTINPPPGPWNGFAQSITVGGNMVIAGEPSYDEFLLENCGLAWVYGYSATGGSDLCAAAPAVSAGATEGCNGYATSDGFSSCSFLNAARDVWHRLSLPIGSTGQWRIDTGGSELDTVLSIHSDCPGTTGNAIACNSDFGGLPASRVVINFSPFNTYLIRISGQNSDTGSYQLNIQPHCAADVAPVPSGDHIVNIDDLLTVINAWGQSVPGGAGDVNASSTTDIDDLLAVINGWGACP
jgi:hypothetical protein